MVSLMVIPNCKACTSSMKMLDDNNIKYDIMDLMDEDNMDIARRHQIRSAGTHLYDSKRDTVISVPDYIGEIKSG